MANEGSTKPTYKDLEEKIAALLDPANPFYALNHATCYDDLRRRNRADLESREIAESELDDAKSELARVRGLLQRIGEIANSDLAWNRRVNTIVELLGAESADIGKLDAADKKEFLYNPPRAKSAEMGKVNRVDGVIGQVYGFDCEETSGCPGTGDPPDQTVPLGCVRAREHLHGEAHDCEPGSAETGGEKADEEVS